jgi:hypothetical protein
MEQSAPLTAELPHFTDCGLPGNSRIPYRLHACHFYPDRQRLVEALEARQALAAGYNGLRITGNTSFLKPGDWATVMLYERAVGEHFYGRRIVALCSYTLEGRSASEVGEVMHAHECVFDRPDATWQVVARPTG